MHFQHRIITWLKPFRLTLCFLASLFTIAGFRLEKIQISWPAVISVFFITCSTMLQNDWRDRYHDRKKGKMLALQYPQTFFILLIVFWTITFGLVIATIVRNNGIGAILIAMIIAGLIYSEIRRIPMASVTLLSFTSGGPILLAVMAGGNGHQAWLLFLSAILIIFGREITKDIDDKSIDSGYKRTLPLLIGNKWTKIIAVLMTMTGLIVATQISTTIIPVTLPILIGVALLLYNVRPMITRIFIDTGMTLTLLTIIFLG